ncbi:MAG: glycosyltransferase family 4 protein [Treponema sp.]|nr:glycosyltransferase family 4 protein [Treponema sp.]
MKKKIIAINGEAWCRTLTGIERLAIEVTQFLDTMVQPGEFELVVPKNARNVPPLHNIAVIRLEANATFFPKWTQIAFQKYVLTHHRISLDFSNTCPFFSPGFEFIHDIYSVLYPEDFTSHRAQLIKLYSNCMYKTIAKRAKHIFTVSEYTKQTIIDTYHINPDRVSVVYSGVSGYNDIQPDYSIFDRLPALVSGEYFFTLGSLSQRKNLAWIAKHAQLYPNEVFAVSGKALPNNHEVPEELEILRKLPNIVLTGYLSDEEVKALVTKSKAFILSSYFEGFGLPPLEALACGTKIIISNKTSLPEIYGDCAYYIDPDDPTTDLSVLMKQSVTSPAEILKKYTLQNTAKRLYSIIQTCYTTT